MGPLGWDNETDNDGDSHSTPILSPEENERVRQEAEEWGLEWPQVDAWPASSKANRDLKSRREKLWRDAVYQILLEYVLQGMHEDLDSYPAVMAPIRYDPSRHDARDVIL